MATLPFSALPCAASPASANITKRGADNLLTGHLLHHYSSLDSQQVNIYRLGNEHTNVAAH